MADEGPMGNIQKLISQIEASDSPTISNTNPSQKLNNPKLCLDPQLLLISLLDSYNIPSSASGPVSASIKSGDRNRRNQLHYETRPRVDEGPRTRIHYDESNDYSERSETESVILENLETFGESDRERYQKRIRRSEDNQRYRARRDRSEKGYSKDTEEKRRSRGSKRSKRRPKVFGVSGSTIHIYYNNRPSD